MLIETQGIMGETCRGLKYKKRIAIHGSAVVG
jgi:hypothetical protein